MTSYLSSISSGRNCHDNPFPHYVCTYLFLCGGCRSPSDLALLPAVYGPIVTMISFCEIFGSLDIQKDNYRIQD